MALPKTSVALFLVVVACVVAIEKPHVEVKNDDAKVNVTMPVISVLKDTSTPLNSTATVSSTPSSAININTNSTSDVPPTTTTTNSPTNTTTTTTTTTTKAPPTSSTTTTTKAPPTTTTTTTTSTTKAPPTTQSPNVTTAAPPTPAPAPGRHWDAPSFFGGMVLAFGIVAVGFVGYRFFYLGRGGAYHTL